MNILFLSLAVVYSLPLYGNFSQFYYYTELENQGRWIIDSSFNGAIKICTIDSFDLNKTYERNQLVVQGFINVVSLTSENEKKLIVGNQTFTIQCAISFSEKQEINNYLGLQEYFNPQKELIQPLRLCLSQNGGYFSLNQSEESSNGIKILYYKNQPSLVLITNMFADSMQLFHSGKEKLIFQAEVDFNYPYLELHSKYNRALRNAFICTDFLCPKRNDQNGLICYERGDMDLNTFYQHFKDFEIEIFYTSVIWYPQDYFVTTDNQTYCFPVKTAMTRNVLGQPFLRNKEFVFNSQHMTIYYNKCDNESQELTSQRLHVPYNKRTQGYSRIQIEYLLMGLTCLIGFVIIRKRSGIEQAQTPINPFTDYQ